MAEKKKAAPTIAEYIVSLKRSRHTKLDAINAMINWKPIESKLHKVLKRTQDAAGKPAYPALVMFKCLLLQRLYNLSDIGLEEAMTDRISFSRFAGLSIESDVPDATTFCRFRNELVGNQVIEKLFTKVLQQITAKGLHVKSGIMVDASVIESARHPQTSLEVIPLDRQEEEAAEPSVKVTHSDDREAAWLKKGKKTHYGYKMHISACAKTGLVLAGHITPANHSDMKGLEKVLSQTPYGRGNRCYADKGYASEANRNIVREQGFKDGIMSKAVRGKALTEREKKRNHQISKVRSGVERIFGTFKQRFRLHRSRYVGQAKVTSEFFLVALVYNLVRAVSLVGC